MCALPRHSPLELLLCYFTDPAFRDRADIIQYIGLPPIEAIFDMLRGSLVELIRKGIVTEMVGFLVLASSHSLLTSQQDIPDRRTISLWKNATVAGLSDVTGWKAAAELWGIAELCKVSLSLPSGKCGVLTGSKQGLSGRALRRLPVLAHAGSMTQGRYYSVPAEPKKATATNGATAKLHRSSMPVEHWLKAMETVVVEQRKQLELLT